jgi:hypothetical protein
MHKTVVALYDNLDDAQQTVRELVDNGLPRDQISLVASDRTGQYGESMSPADQPSGAVQGAGVGAGIGAALGGIGGLLVGLGALAIPGIGPVIAAGPLAAALGGIAGAGVGAVAGGAAGGLIGGLTDMGVTEAQAGYFAEGVRRGGSLVTVRTEDPVTERAKDVMNRHHPIDVNERAAEWRQGGWTGFSPTATPYRGDAGSVTDVNPQAPVSAPEAPYPGTAIDDDEMGNSGMGAASMEDVSTPTAEDVNRPHESVRTGDYTGMMDSGGVVTGPANPDLGATMRPHDYTFYDADFRNHYASEIGDRGGNSFDQYAPAYRYGYDLAGNERYSHQDWTEVEPEARQFWEERHPGTWDTFRAAIYHAWMSVHDSQF